MLLLCCLFVFVCYTLHTWCMFEMCSLVIVHELFLRLLYTLQWDIIFVKQYKYHFLKIEKIIDLDLLQKSRVKARILDKKGGIEETERNYN